MIDPFKMIEDNLISDILEFISLHNINILNEDSQSLLHYSIIFHNFDIFKILIEHYIDINLKDKNGETALNYAIVYNRLGFFKALIDRNANIELKNKKCETAIFKAILYNRSEFIDLLIEKGANLNVKDINDENILFAVIRSHNMNLIQQFFKPELVNIKNYQSESLLHIAVGTSDFEVTKFLIENNAFINIKNKNKETPLFYSVKNENREILSLLIKNGAIADIKNIYFEDIFKLIEQDSYLNYIEEQINSYNYRNYLMTYPLHLAIIKEDVFEVERQIKISTLNRKDSFGYLPMDLALNLENKKIIELLKKAKKELII